MIVDGGRTADESAAAAAVLGLRHFGRDEAEPFDIWPEHWTAVQVFVAMGTQWSVGMAGAIGLRYEALPVVMDLQDVPREERRHVFDCLRTMEGEALRVFAERRSGGADG